MFARILIFVGLVSAGLLLILLTTTAPASAGAFGILAVFLLSYVFVLSLTTFLLWLIAILINKAMTSVNSSGRGAYSISLRKAYYFSTIIALGPVIVVSLHSVGGVGIYELGLVALFISLGCLYVARRTA